MERTVKTGTLQFQRQGKYRQGTPQRTCWASEVTGAGGGPGPLQGRSDRSGFPPCHLVERESRGSQHRSWVCGQEVGLTRQEEAELAELACPGPLLCSTTSPVVSSALNSESS